MFFTLHFLPFIFPKMKLPSVKSFVKCLKKVDKVFILKNAEFFPREKIHIYAKKFLINVNSVAFIYESKESGLKSCA